MKSRISLENAVDAFAGLMVLLSVALTWFVHPGFIGLTAFVGINFFQDSSDQIVRANIEIFYYVLVPFNLFTFVCRMCFIQTAEEHMLNAICGVKHAGAQTVWSSF